MPITGEYAAHQETDSNVMEAPFHYVRSRSYAETVDLDTDSEPAAEFAYIMYSRRPRRLSLVPDDESRATEQRPFEPAESAQGDIASRAKVSYAIAYSLLGVLSLLSLATLFAWCSGLRVFGISRGMMPVIALVLGGLSVEMAGGIVWLRLNIQHAITTANGATQQAT
jgi:hypothetical protein